MVKVRGLPASDEDHPFSHLDHPSSLSAGQWRPHYRVLGYRTSAIPPVRTRRRHRGRGHRSAVPQCLQPLQWLHSARGYSGERRRDRRPGRTASTTIPTNTSLQLPLPTIADQPSRLAGGDVAGHRLAVQNRQPLDHPDALPGQPQRNTSRTSNTRTSRNAIAASEPRSTGTAARAPSPGPALVVPGRWSHHWRWDGPMPLAQLNSRRSHTAGGRHALTRLLGSSSAGGIRSRGDGRVVSQHGMTCSCWLGRPLAKLSLSGDHGRGTLAVDRRDRPQRGPEPSEYAGSVETAVMAMPQLVDVRPQPVSPTDEFRSTAAT